MARVKIRDQETGQEFEMDVPEDATDEEILEAAREQWQPKSDKSNMARNIALGAGAGALTAFGVGRVFRRAFPGLSPKKSAVRWLEDALRKDSLDLRSEFAEYMKAASASPKPLTFADWLAMKPGAHEFESLDLIKGAMRRAPSHAGKREAILAGREASQRDRVLQTLIDELQIPPQAFDDPIEAVMKSQPEAAKLGMDLFQKKGPSAKELSELVDAMRPEERVAFGRGLVENLRGMNTRTMLSRLVNDPGNYPLVTERLQAVFPGDSYERFLGAVADEQKMTAGKRALSGARSPTSSAGIGDALSDIAAEHVVPGGSVTRRLVPQGLRPGASKGMSEYIADIGLGTTPKGGPMLPHPGEELIGRYGGQRWWKPSGLDWLRVPGGAAAGAYMEGSEYKRGGLAHTRERY